MKKNKYLKMEKKENNKVQWLLEYSRTAENTSNRRIRITANILKFNLINPMLSLVAITLQKEFNLNKIYIIFFTLFVLILSILLTIAMGFNYKNNKDLNKIKYEIIIKYEKELFGKSLYDEEYKPYLNLGNNCKNCKRWKNISFIEFIFSLISFFVTIFTIFTLIFYIILLFC